MQISYPSSSPYAVTPQTSWHITPMVFRPIPPDAGDTPYTLKMQHQYRPDRLSFDLYGTPAYWWTFCVRNPFLRRDPIWGFTAGLQITVPAAAYLRRVLGG
jgi:hypothetical protein